MSTLSRREWLARAASAAAALALAPLAARAQGTTAGFTLPKLPYPPDALEPSIDKMTMEIHHDKHHQAYVTGLNAALAKHPDLLATPIDKLMTGLLKLPADVQAAVRNNGGGHYNHTLFWNVMGPSAGGEPSGNLGDAVKSTFGDFEKFKTAFGAAAASRFGSGWAWLVKTSDGKLKIGSTQNQDCPLSSGEYPVLGLDVWEHAYYLKYQNRRPEYVANWWKVVNWKMAGERFARGATS
jgi:Fe-Mn family superoxide dismutase